MATNEQHKASASSTSPLWPIQHRHQPDAERWRKRRGEIRIDKPQAGAGQVATDSQEGQGRGEGMRSCASLITAGYLPACPMASAAIKYPYAHCARQYSLASSQKRWLRNANQPRPFFWP